MKLKLKLKIEAISSLCLCDYWEPVLVKEVNEVKIATTAVIISFIVFCPRTAVRENSDHRIETESKLKPKQQRGT